MIVIRRIHLWVGVILSLVLLCEGLTGLILAAPSIFGQGPQEGRPAEIQDKVQGEKREMTAGEGEFKRNPVTARGDNSLLMIARTLHEGRIGTLNLRWLVALSGIGLAILCITGVFMAITYFRK
jgi:hypothetical protein